MMSETENSELLSTPYDTVLKPYGEALRKLAADRQDIICLGADLTRQTETDIFRDAIPERFINVGMAEANLMSIAGAMARAGKIVFVNTFGVFCTRRCFDQIAMAVAYPKVNVKIVGFMPGLSSPGGPSHQAIEDVALMRSLPNMTVVEPADATEITQAVQAIADRPGPVYMRLKRGEIPRIFGSGHKFVLNRAQIILGAGKRTDVSIITAGMMVPMALSAAQTLRESGVIASVVNVPVIKPLDSSTVLESVNNSRFAVSVENHTTMGGLGSAVAEAMADAGAPVPLRRLGIQDVFGESGSHEFLFSKYGLDTQTIINAVWAGLEMQSARPTARVVATRPGAYAPV
jgi:transketolase